MSAAYEHGESRWALAPVLVATVIIAMVWYRYTGNWAEVDTSVLTRAARATHAEHTIQPRDGVYLNGFTYPALLAFLSTTTGLSIASVQTMVVPFCYITMGLIIFIVFRATIGNGKLAAISSCLLLIQPDFLFVNQRGSHEKVTWALVLTLFFALLTSIRQQRFNYAAPMAVIFYLCGFALISTNAFFASSLITSFILSFIGGTLLIRWLLRNKALRPSFRRLGYVFVTMSVLSYLYMVYVFPPVRANLANLQSVFDRVSALYLDLESTGQTTNVNPNQSDTSGGDNRTTAPSSFEKAQAAAATPYKTVSLAWTNPRVFFALTSLTWLLIAMAGIAWLISLFRYMRNGVPRDRVPLFLVWMLAGATGFQILASVIADAAGALGSNMQLRLFPSFTLFVIPLVVATLRVPNRIWSIQHVPTITYAAGAIAFGFFSLMAYFKATNDPIFSNKWVFYTAEERSTIQWADNNLESFRIWADYDERYVVASLMLADDKNGAQDSGANWMTGQVPSPVTRYIVDSPVTELRLRRVSLPAPDLRTMDIVYDNGSVQIYHRIPETPYVP